MQRPRAGLRPGRRGFAVWLISALSLANPLAAESLVPSPPLAADVQALPRLEGDTAIATRINTALAEIDAHDLQLATCDDENPDDAYRAVETLAAGADFLTFVIEIGGYCPGAAHPWGQQTIVNFDMQSGEATDLEDYFPSDWPDTGDPPEQLFDLYLKAAGPELAEDCFNSLRFAMDEFDLWFDIGLDDKVHQLLLLPQGLPYAVSGCESIERLGPEDLQAAGFHPRLIGALGAGP